MVDEYSHPATLLKITSNPMNTMTTVSTGACSTGRITTRSRSTPAAKEIATVRPKALQ